MTNYKLALLPGENQRCVALLRSVCAVAAPPSLCRRLDPGVNLAHLQVPLATIGALSMQKHRPDPEKPAVLVCAVMIAPRRFITSLMFLRSK
jgi:hypothetical protein